MGLTEKKKKILKETKRRSIKRAEMKKIKEAARDSAMALAILTKKRL